MDSHLPNDTRAIIKAFEGKQLFDPTDESFSSHSSTWQSISMSHNIEGNVDMISTTTSTSLPGRKKQKVNKGPLDMSAVYKYLRLSRRVSNKHSSEVLLHILLPGVDMDEIKRISSSKAYQEYCKLRLNKIRMRGVAASRGVRLLMSPKINQDLVETCPITPDSIKRKLNPFDEIQQIPKLSTKGSSLCSLDGIVKDRETRTRDVLKHVVLFDEEENHSTDLFGILSDEDISHHIGALEAQYALDEPCRVPSKRF